VLGVSAPGVSSLASAQEPAPPAAPAQSTPPNPSTLIIEEGLSSAPGSTGQSRHESADGIRSKILHLWFARKAALDASDTVSAQARVEELRAYMVQEGITADRTVARGFAYEGYENLREGNYERAREAFDLARSFDPYLPQAQCGYAWSQLRAGKGFFLFLNEYAKGLKLAWGRFITDEVQISNFSVVAALALLCSMVAFSLVVILRCQGRARHDLFESARRILPESAARIVAWSILLLPILVWAGGLWLILFWLVLCFRYMRLPEKVVALCVFVMIGLAPLGVTAVLDRVQSSTNPETRVVVSAMQAGYNPETLRQLKQVVAAHDDDTELHLLLGTAYARGDLLSEAFDEYQRVLDREPSNAVALVDAGNVYFRLAEFAQAVNNYKKAAQAAPELVSAHWNMYLAQNELLHFAEADASLARARVLDPALSGQLLARKKDENGGVLLLEEPASLGRLKSILRSGARFSAEQVHALANPLSLASAIALVFSLLLSIGGAEASSQACVRCGRAHCERCRVDLGASGCCARCVHLFFKKEGITAEMRSEGLTRLRRRDRATSTVRRALSLLLPGSGQILAGRIGVGFPVMIGWVCALIFIAAQDRLLLAPRVPVSDLPPPGVVVAVILMGVFWIVGNVVSTRRPIMSEMADGA
jgi:tetratricopeptide (TPR) repeat protein